LATEDLEVLRRELLVLIPASGTGTELALGELARRAAQLSLLVGEREVDHSKQAYRRACAEGLLADEPTVRADDEVIHHRREGTQPSVVDGEQW
jgi:phosphopantothenate synthetase